MAYNVFSGTLDPTQSINQSTTLCNIICVTHKSIYTVQ